MQYKCDKVAVKTTWIKNGYFNIIKDMSTVCRLLILRDGFTHRQNRPWPRAPHFWGPRATLPMTTQYQLKICETAQRHNFTIYLETSGNANVYSRLLSVQ